ncbi:MAG: carboxypeptidase regulatory-like domain-containing protein [Acidobacteria bacterium]|nr:carboxypeptidase regulatory-like domain-containing protein [Acidobacteriota bacterium]MBI1983380.1 carboxypeptidase regulatory-like domain-containing protein [Acidobacteriota bacterium]
MLGLVGKKELVTGCVLAISILLAGSDNPAWADSPERTNVIVVVREAETDEPIFQARLTLQFKESRKLKRDKRPTFTAKTNAQGRYKFNDIPKGTIRLMVTAERRQSYGEELELVEDDQVIEVKLRKPEPLL